jgi:ribonuclease I
MKYNLVNKHTNEVVHTIDLSDEVGISGARTYFKGTKRLADKEFDKLFRVRYHEMSKNPIKWWEEEKAITDEELNLF